MSRKLLFRDLNRLVIGRSAFAGGLVRLSMALLIVVIALNREPICVWSQQLRAEEDFFNNVPLVTPVVFRVNNDASYTLIPEREVKNNIVMPPRFDELVLLTKPWVQDELKLTDTQRRHFQDAYDEIYLRVDYRKRVPDKLTDVLEKQQQDRFRELLIRCRIRAMGLVRFFGQPALALPDEEVNAIREMIAKLEPEYSSKLKELRDQTVEALLAHLTDEQQQTFAQMSAGFLDANPTPLALLFWQLSNVDRFEEVIVEKEYPDFRGLLLPFLHFRFDVDGNVEEEARMPGSFDVSKMTELVKKRHEMALSNILFFGIMKEVTSDSGFLELQLTPEQRERYLHIAKRKSLFDHEVTKLEENGPFGEKEYEEYQIRDFQICAEINREFLNEILLPHQRNILESFSMILEVVRGGHVSALVHGYLGEKLKISARQRQALLDQAKESVKEINSKTAQWEDEIFREIRAVLSKESRNRLADLFCDSPGQGPANLELMLKGD